MSLRIAVVGGGHGGYAAAADLAEQGHRVRLWRRDSEQLRLLAERGSIELTDHRGSREVPLHLVSADLGAIADGAELVLIALPSTAQEELAPLLVPFLSDDQVVLLTPGNLGACIFANALHAERGPTGVVLGETSTLPYIARKRSPTEVTITTRATRLSTGFLPSARSAAGLEVLSAAYPRAERVVDVLDAALLNLGPTIHVPLVLLNAGAIEAELDWNLLRQGSQPSVQAVQFALDAERIALREALGYPPPHFVLSSHHAGTGEDRMYGNLASERPAEPAPAEQVDLRKHRFVTEDLVDGLMLLESIADWAGVPVPVAKALATLAGRMLDLDLAAEGRTLERLGLAGLDAEGLRQRLRQGLA